MCAFLEVLCLKLSLEMLSRIDGAKFVIQRYTRIPGRADKHRGRSAWGFGAGFSAVSLASVVALRASRRMYYVSPHE